MSAAAEQGNDVCGRYNKEKGEEKQVGVMHGVLSVVLVTSHVTRHTSHVTHHTSLIDS